MAKLKKNILTCISTNGPLTTSELISKLNLSREQVYNAVHRLKKEDTLIKTHAGSWEIHADYNFEPKPEPVTSTGKNLISDLQIMLNDVDKYKGALRKIDTALAEVGL